MKLALLLLAPLLAATGLLALYVYWYGRRLPPLRRRVFCTEYPVPPTEIWSSLIDRGQVSQFGLPMKLVTESAQAPKRLVLRVSEPQFESTWTCELEPTEEEGTFLTIVEESRVRPTLLRGFAALFLDQNAPVKAFLG